MNIVSATTVSTPHTQLSSSAPPAAPSASPAPAAAITLSAQAQTALALGHPNPNNIIWGSGPSR